MKVSFRTVGAASVEEMERNRQAAIAAGYPYVGTACRSPLAVVGGGPSIRSHVEELRNWQGDVWACGSPFPWCVRNGIDAVYFTIDPGEPVAALVSEGAARAILASCVHPDVFASCRSVEIFDLLPWGENHGVTTATAAPHLAVSMGYTDISIFGCESSFEGDQSHAYETAKDLNDRFRMRVVTNGESFITIPSIFMQAEMLAKTIRLAPHVFKERSGGLLRAMVEDDDYDVTHGIRELHEAFGLKVAA